MDSYRRNNVEARKLLDYQFPSPVSVLEHSIFAESCSSSDTADSINTGGKSSAVKFYFHFFSLLISDIVLLSKEYKMKPG